MSGAEASLIIGLISGIVAIVDATKTVYDAVKDQHGLPDALREVAKRLPLVKDNLEKVKTFVESGRMGDEAMEAAKHVLEHCNQRVADLETIFKKVSPLEGDSRMNRYFKAVKTLGKDGKVEKLMKGILEDLSILATRSGMETKDDIENLSKALSELSVLPPSVPDHVFDETKTSYKNTNSGSGTQHNYNPSGGENVFYSGSGHQVTGSHATLNFSK
jgi:hypothetical protein